MRHHDIPDNHEHQSFPTDMIFESGDNARYHQPLQPNKTFHFSHMVPIAQLDNGIAGPINIVATISTSASERITRKRVPELDEFAIVDMRSIPVNGTFDGSRSVFERTFMGAKYAVDVQYLVISRKDFATGHHFRGLKGIHPGESVLFGRENPQLDNRFDFSNHTSGKHFRLSLDNSGRNLEISDLGSLNGTLVNTDAQLIDIEYATGQNARYERSPFDEEYRERMRKIHEEWKRRGRPQTHRSEIDDLRGFVGDAQISTHELNELIHDIGVLKQDTSDMRKLGRLIAAQYHPDRGFNRDDVSDTDRARRDALYKAAKHIAGI